MYGDIYVWTPYVSYICTVYCVDNKYHLSAVMYGQLMAGYACIYYYYISVVVGLLIVDYYISFVFGLSLCH